MPALLGFGTAPIGELFETLTEPQAFDTLAAAWAAGVRYFDSSPWYGRGLAELRLGAFLRSQRREEFVGWARSLLKTVGLAEHENKYPWQLSGGMQQRASICRALIHQPRLLMLDEPFGALDAFTREELWCVLRDLWEAQRFTVVLVTHDLREAAFLADTVYVMSRRPGRVIERRSIELPRPRALETTYEKPFIDLVQELRAQIGEVRST